MALWLDNMGLSTSSSLWIYFHYLILCCYFYIPNASIKVSTAHYLNDNSKFIYLPLVSQKGAGKLVKQLLAEQ